MVRVRVRQHVNPFSKKYQQPIPPPNWEQIYENPNQLLHLDIGCAHGIFALNMAKQEPKVNFLGIEIREILVEKANLQRDELGLTNLHYLFGNVNYDFAVLLNSLPPGVLQQVTIQFPDPWFKKRHNKRRVVQPELVDTLSRYLVPGGLIFLQSDVEEVALAMRKEFAACSGFKLQHESFWLARNPFPVATEREEFTIGKGEPVYRVLLEKYKNLGGNNQDFD